MLAIASSRSRTFSPTLLEPEPDVRRRRNLHASRVRSPESIRQFETATNWACDHSKINFFQSLRLRGEIEIFSHCFGARSARCAKANRDLVPH